MFNKIKDYDERELQIRGKVFMHSFMLALLLLVLTSFSDFIFYDHGREGFVFVFILMSQTMSELILTGGIGRSKLLTAVMIALTVIGIFFTVSGILQGELLIDNKLTLNANILIEGILMLIIPLVFFIKMSLDKKRISL